MLKKDEIWEVFNGVSDLDTFQNKLLEPIYLKQQVPDDIKTEIKLVDKLLKHSYFEYQFIDLALTQAIFALEKCMRIRYKEINNKSSKSILFVALIDWFFENNYFEIWNKDILTILRTIRNGKLHGEKKTIGGVAFIHKVYSVIYLINDLYENPTLRKTRILGSTDLQSNLNELLVEGGVLSYNNKRIIFFKADLVFFNNKTIPNTINLVVWSIFDLTTFKQEKQIIPYSFEISNWKFQIESFSGLNISDNTEIIVSKIKNENDVNKFTKWRSEFQSLPNFTLLFHCTFDLDDYFYSALKKFHQLN
ncbi:MAG: hypothetical protein HY951_15380 [Bacteroidia bacterium]|nr:hypothetical protein [Bacteroidia bacterium]